MNFLTDIPNLRHTGSGNFFLIAGPCVVESEENVFQVAEVVKGITDRLEIPYIFKASYRKANRTRPDAYTGPGDRQALAILDRVRKELSLPVLTDIHTPAEAAIAARSVDVLQIPAFLSRQTDLLTAAGRTGLPVNIKKGQFMAPEAMHFAAAKVAATGNHRIFLTDRGTMFGYHDLIVDFRSIPVMQGTGYPVVVDITHSLQQPNQRDGITGGRPELIATLGRAAIAAGADGIFLETHPDPPHALSDGANMLPLNRLEELLQVLVKIRRAVQ